MLTIQDEIKIVMTGREPTFPLFSPRNYIFLNVGNIAGTVHCKVPNAPMS